MSATQDRQKQTAKRSSNVSSAVAVKKKKSAVKILSNWNIKVSSKELALVTALSGKPLMILRGPFVNGVFISADHNHVVSTRLVRQKMKEWGGDPSSLKVRKSKKGKVFSFLEENKVHWISTDGGYLIVEANSPLTKKQYRSLRRRVSRSF